MKSCTSCARAVDESFRYCPWCAAPQRRKLVEFFRGVDQDARNALRVSRYIPEHRVRFSIWDENGTARAAVSLDDDEAARLAEFVRPQQPGKRPSILDDLRALVKH
jgi:hypothetical protein